MPIVPPVSAKVRLVAPREWSSPRAISAQSLQRNEDRRSTFCQINDNKHTVISVKQSSQLSYRLRCIYPCNWGRSQNWGSRRRRPVSGISAARRGISAPVCRGEGPGWISVRDSCCPTACAPHPSCCSLQSRIHRSPRTFSGTKDPAQKKKAGESEGGYGVEDSWRGPHSARLGDFWWN